MAQGAGNRYQRATEPAAPPAESPAWQLWFTRAPYPGLIGVGVGLLLAIAVAAMHQPRDDRRIAAATPPPPVSVPEVRSTPRVSVSPAPHLDAQSSQGPRVIIQPLPVPPAAGNQPAANAPAAKLPATGNGP